MARRIRLSTWYARNAPRILSAGAGRSNAIAYTARALAALAALPGPADYEAMEHPVGRAWVRRVAGRNLWLWYRFTDDEISLVLVTTEPPVPVA